MWEFSFTFDMSNMSQTTVFPETALTGPASVFSWDLSSILQHIFYKGVMLLPAAKVLLISWVPQAPALISGPPRSSGPQALVYLVIPGGLSIFLSPFQLHRSLWQMLEGTFKGQIYNVIAGSFLHLASPSGSRSGVKTVAWWLGKGLGYYIVVAQVRSQLTTDRVFLVI